MTTCATPSVDFSATMSTLYKSGCTFNESAKEYEKSFHKTTGSIPMHHGSSSLSNNTSSSNCRSSTKAPMGSARKAARSGNSANVVASSSSALDLSPTSMALSLSMPSSSKRDAEGRPSIGTITLQWEYMRTTCYNNDDSEIAWAMVARKEGAYKAAHARFSRAEDQYFKTLYDINVLEGRVQSAASGPGARVPALIGELKNLCMPILALPSSVETGKAIDTTMETLQKLVEASTNTQTEESVLSIFTRKTEASIRAIMAEPDKQKLTRMARALHPSLGEEVTVLRSQLSMAQKDNEEALEEMEKWAKREKEAHDYAREMQKQDAAWFAQESIGNTDALTLMRSFIPLNVAELSVNDIMQAARESGEQEPTLYTLELATEIKQNKLLHWLVMHPDDIALDSFLTGERKAIFENVDALDIIELRALAKVLPEKFENDKDGRKAEWRSRVMARVKQLVSQENGDFVKSGYDPTQRKRGMVKLPPLKPDQQRRPVYYYRTKDKSMLKVKQYNDKHSLLERKKAALEKAEITLKDAKKEYTTVLEEMRDPDFLAQHGPELLGMAKEKAKQLLADADSNLKQLKRDVVNLTRTIEGFPVTRERYLEMEEELVAFLQEHRGVDWAASKEAIEITGAFYCEDSDIKRIERAAAKFVSAEEEALLRKAEMEQIMSRRTEDAEAASMAATVATAAAAAALAGMHAPAAAGEGAADGAAPAAVDGVPCTPGPAAAAAGAEGTQTPCAPATEFRRLPASAFGLFSPGPARNPSDAAAMMTPVGATPRRKNSVLANANPEMLAQLNRMLAASPAATPKVNRGTIFSAASAVKLNGAAGAAGAEDANGEAAEAKKKEIKVTKSKVLQVINLNTTQKAKYLRFISSLVAFDPIH
jgi:hypothetical protein